MFIVDDAALTARLLDGFEAEKERRIRDSANAEDT
jgi:hypothetical protein